MIIAFLHKSHVFCAAPKALDSSPAGDARSYKSSYTVLFDLVGDLFILTDHVGPRPHNTHIPLKYIQKLGQFIQVGFSQ